MGSKRKIFIIGNGFDIAFNQPTRYKNLMEDIYDSVKNSNKIPVLKKLFPGMDSLIEVKEIIYGDIKSEFILLNLESRNSFISTGKSILFKELINDFESKKNWGNVELIYYICLKKCVNKSQIKTLNEELDHLRDLLVFYLDRIEKEIPNSNKLYLENNIQHIICHRDWKYSDLFSNYLFDSIFFVSFNYTSKILEEIVNNELPKTRRNKFKSEIIHIHGKLNDNSNPCVFGYGDDNSKTYNELENKLDYYCLRQFKTKQYLKSNQYHKLLGSLEGYEIHVEIIGHSCEMCDKSLLNTIFTHPNVKKLKINYHGNSDNFFKTVHNISKIIEDNIMLREKLEPINKCHLIKCKSP